MLVYHADTNSTVFSFNVLPVLFITYTVLYIEPDERNTFFLQVKVAKTKVKLGPDPVFDEEFELGTNVIFCEVL